MPIQVIILNMFSKIKRLGTTACQVQISLDLKELTILEKRKDISSIFVEFERKTKAISSLSLPWSDTNSPSVIAFDESLLLLTTLYRDSSGRFLEKNGNLLLKGYSTATSSTVKLGFVVLKLNSLAADYAPDTIEDSSSPAARSLKYFAVTDVFIDPTGFPLPSKN